MYFAIERNDVMAGKSVFGNVDRCFVSFVEEARSPVEVFRCYRPVNGSFRESVIAFYKLRFAVFCYNTFNLIGTGSCSPYKIRREFYFTRRIIGDFSYRGFISFLF